MEHRWNGGLPGADASANGSTPIRVLLVDDQRLVREGLRELLSAERDMTVVGEAETAAGALAACRQPGADVLVVDAVLPEMAALMLIREVRSRFPMTQVLAVAERDGLRGKNGHCGAQPRSPCYRPGVEPLAHGDCLELALMAGARGVLRKTCSRHELSQAIRAVARGEPWLEFEMALSVIDRLRQTPGTAINPLTPEGLTRREVEIIRELLFGRSNKEISQALGISQQTVKNGVSRVLDKLELQDRVQIALYAVDTRLLERYAALLS